MLRAQLYGFKISFAIYFAIRLYFCGYVLFILNYYNNDFKLTRAHSTFKNSNK